MLCREILVSWELWQSLNSTHLSCSEAVKSCRSTLGLTVAFSQSQECSLASHFPPSSLLRLDFDMSSPKPTSPLAQGSPKRAATALPPPVGLASPKPAPAAGGGKVDKNAQKAAKAAKRAAAKGLQVGEQAAAPVAQQQGGLKDKGGKPAAGAGGAQATKAAAGGAQASGSKGGEAAAGAGRVGQQQGAAATDNTDPLQLFLHLDLPSHSSQLSHSSKSSTSNIHPSIIRLALQYSEFKIVGANARCIAMLEALKDVSSARRVFSRARRLLYNRLTVDFSARPYRLFPPTTLPLKPTSPVIFPPLISTPKSRTSSEQGLFPCRWEPPSGISSTRSVSSIRRWMWRR